MVQYVPEALDELACQFFLVFGGCWERRRQLNYLLNL